MFRRNTSLIRKWNTVSWPERMSLGSQSRVTWNWPLAVMVPWGLPSFALKTRSIPSMSSACLLLRSNRSFWPSTTCTTVWFSMKPSTVITRPGTDRPLTLAEYSANRRSPKVFGNANSS